MAGNHSALYAHRLLSCHHCETVQPAANQSCSFCGHAIHGRKHQGLQRSWIFVLTALLFYIPANVMPIMVTSQQGKESFNTIASGVVLLWEDGSYMVSAIIFIASLLVPPAKFIALIWLCLCEQFALYKSPRGKTTVYRAAEFVGRWSMLDVFVVAFLAGLIQMGNLMSIYPGPAAVAFGGMVVFTMLAANSLDPKVFWDDDD